MVVYSTVHYTHSRLECNNQKKKFPNCTPSICPEGIQVIALLCSAQQRGALNLPMKMWRYIYFPWPHLHLSLATPTFVPSYASYMPNYLQDGTEFFDKGMMEFLVDEGFDASMKGDFSTSTSQNTIGVR